MMSYTSSCGFNPVTNGCPTIVNSERHGTSQCTDCGFVFYTQSGLSYDFNSPKDISNEPIIRKAFQRPKSN